MLSGKGFFGFVFYCGSFYVPFCLSMDSSQIIDKLSELIKRITETGDWVLDPDDLKVRNNTL